VKILAINWQDLTNPQAGGAEVHLEEILKRVAARGHRVTLFCSSYPGARKTEWINGIEIIRKGSRYNFNFVVQKYIRSLIASRNPDLVIEDINKIPFYTPLFQNLPTLVAIPHLFADSVFKEINFVMGLYIFLSEKPIPNIYKGKKFMVISDSTKDDLVRRNIPEQDVHVVKCGIDHVLYCPDPDTQKSDPPLAVYVGRLKKYKTIDCLIRAMALVSEELPEARLVIVGDGDYAPKLVSLTRELKLKEKVKFTGFVPQLEKVNWLRKAWVAIYPSLKEGWGLTNIEANACGTPVLASDVPGLRDSVSAGETGLLFEYGNAKKLAQLMVKVMSDSPLREKLSRGGLRWAQEFSWDKAADQTLELCHMVVDGNKRR
jgi:glycosyltransferase involved in cell wall biosynthesis